MEKGVPRLRVEKGAYFKLRWVNDMDGPWYCCRLLDRNGYSTELMW